MAKDKQANPVLVTSSFDRYFPDKDEKIDFTSSALKVVEWDIPKESQIATAVLDTGETFQGLTVRKKIELVHATQPSLSDTQLQRMEGSVRRNWAVRSGLSVREFFTFGYGSSLVIELPESEKIGLNQKQIQDKIDQLTTEHIEILKKCYNRDQDVKLIPNVKTMTWQAWLFGRGLIIKFFNETETQLGDDVTRLKALNTRRLGMPIFDDRNDMAFEGVIVDGQGLDKSAMIYAVYDDYELSPHTEGYGYSPLETIQHIAEELNIATEEDFKEILKSAWLASILFVFNTTGLTAAQAKTKINTLIKNIKAGKYIGINEDVIKHDNLNLNPDFDGLVKLTDNLETKIYKALHVPQFLVQSESIANRATALQSASLFINGVITNDQKWIEDILQEQWYDPFLMQELKNNKNVDFNEDKRLPFHVRRVFNQAKVADFIDLADAITKLIGAGVWDVEKANEELTSEEVTERVQDDMMAQQLRDMTRTSFRENPLGDRINGITTGTANIDDNIKTLKSMIKKLEKKKKSK